MLLRGAAAALLLAAACGDPPSPCTGDCSAPIVVQAMGMFDYQPVDLADGSMVSIMPPLQGGYVIYVGVRAQNVHGLTAQVTAAVRDTATPRVLTLEHRPVRLLPSADGWARPESGYQDLANVAVCSVTEAVDFDQATWRLEVTLEDEDGRTGETAVLIRPVCSNDDQLGCECACDSERPKSGECAVDPVDGGVPDASPDAP